MCLHIMQDKYKWDDLRLAQAIGEMGSLTGAARSLQIDHSTAFRRLQALEARLGAHLFNRARDGYVPTPAGEEVIAAAAQILDALGELERRVAGEALSPSGVVRLTLPDTLMTTVAPLLQAFHKEYPAIVVETAIDNAFFRLSKRDADVALRPAASAPEDLAGRRISIVGTTLYASEDYLAGRGKDLALDAHDWLCPDDSLSQSRSARWIASRIPAERIVHKANSLLALSVAAGAGLGVAALPCYLGDPDPGLCRLSDPVPAMETELWLLVHPDLRHAARVRALLDFLWEGLQKQRNLLEGYRSDASN